MRKEQIAVIALAGWLIAISVFMVLAQSVNLEIFFVLSLIGFLIIVELMGTKYIRTGYQRYLHIFLAVALIIFGLIVFQKVLEILGFEIVI